MLGRTESKGTGQTLVIHTRPLPGMDCPLHQLQAPLVCWLYSHTIQKNEISLVTQCNEVEREMIPNNVTGDSVIQISISVMLKKDFGGIGVYKSVTRIYYPSWSQLSTSEDYTVQYCELYTQSFTILWIAINGLGSRIHHRKSVSGMRNWLRNCIFFL